MPPGRKAARCAVYLSAAPGRSRRRIGAIKERAAAFTMMRVGPCRCVPDALPGGLRRVCRRATLSPASKA